MSTSIASLSSQFLQKCSVSKTAKGKGKEGQTLKRSMITVKKGGAAADETPKGGGPRRSEFEILVNDCLNSTAPIRSLKPNERAREAEREKMGLVSEARKKEIEHFKKIKKQKENDKDKVIMGTPGLDWISLGLVDADKIPKYELTVEDGRKLAKEYSRVLMRRHRARQAAETNLLKSKNAAIEALPENLKAAAMVPDYTPFPANRYMATLTPPIEGYSDSINDAAKRGGVKEKIR